MVMPLNVLEKSINKRVQLLLKDNRILEGKLVGYDDYMNMVLEDTEETKEDNVRRVGTEVRVVEEAKPLGTAGAIKNIQRHVRGTFAVYNGDVVDTIELDRFVEAHRQRRGIGTIAVWPVDDPSAFGVVGIEDGRITRFVEKPRPGEAPSNLVNAGRYVFEPMVFDFIEEGRAVSLERDVFPRLVEHGVTAYRYD